MPSDPSTALSLWFKEGELLVGSDGLPYLCDRCPCGPPEPCASAIRWLKNWAKSNLPEDTPVYDEGPYLIIRQHAGGIIDIGEPFVVAVAYVVLPGGSVRYVSCNCRHSSEEEYLIPEGYTAYITQMPSWCACDDMRRFVMDNPTLFGVVDWQYGSNSILKRVSENGVEEYMVFHSTWNVHGYPGYLDYRCICVIVNTGSGYMVYGLFPYDVHERYSIVTHKWGTNCVVRRKFDYSIADRIEFAGYQLPFDVGPLAGWMTPEEYEYDKDTGSYWKSLYWSGVSFYYRLTSRNGLEDDRFFDKSDYAGAAAWAAQVNPLTDEHTVSGIVINPQRSALLPYIEPGSLPISEVPGKVTPVYNNFGDLSGYNASKGYYAAGGDTQYGAGRISFAMTNRGLLIYGKEGYECMTLPGVAAVAALYGRGYSTSPPHPDDEYGFDWAGSAVAAIPAEDTFVGPYNCTPDDDMLACPDNPPFPPIPPQPPVPWPSEPSDPSSGSIPSEPSSGSIPSVPSVPSYPSEPSSGSAPSVPSEPSVPSAPSYPSEPSHPSYPSTPSVPSYPSEPSSGSTPSVPSVPSYPSEPSSGSTPSEPSVPSTPSEPSVPSTPSGHSEPSTPSEPPGPSTPSEPPSQASGTEEPSSGASGGSTPSESGAADSWPSAPDGPYIVIDLSGGPSAGSYPVSTLAGVPEGGWTDEYKTTKLVLRRIPAGTFMMGAHPYDSTQGLNETRHRVTITKPFFIGVFQATQKQWNLVMGTWTGYFNNPSYRDTRPVDFINYSSLRGNDVGAGWPSDNNVDQGSFLDVLREKTGLTIDLPTEAQWEYACRAGVDAAFNIGGALEAEGPCDPDMGMAGRYRCNGGGRAPYDCDISEGTNKVGSYTPNNWGLYDMHGNVYEWCLDWYCTDLGNGNETDPQGPATGQSRVLRGGTYSVYAEECRASARTARSGAHAGTGFRLAAVFGSIPPPIYSDSTSSSVPVPPWSDPTPSYPSVPQQSSSSSSSVPVPPWSDPTPSYPSVPQQSSSVPVPPWSDPGVPPSEPYAPSDPGYQYPSNPYYDSSDMGQPYDY